MILGAMALLRLPARMPGCCLCDLSVNDIGKPRYFNPTGRWWQGVAAERAQYPDGPGASSAWSGPIRVANHPG